MAGPLDILKSLAGTHSKSGSGATASAPKLPAMDSKTVKSYKELETTLNGIQKEMRGIATSSGATAELGNLAKKARKLQPLYKAIEDVKEAESKYLKLMKSSTATIHEQVTAYNKLAAAKKKQVQIGNEMKGVFGRLKNVMSSFSVANLALGAAALVLRDVVLVARQANEGFDVMARSGQALGKSVGQLTAATANYSLRLNEAAITGALMGHSGDESKKAFQLLTQTFGGTGDAIENVSNNFGDLATIAKFSGMSIGDAAAYADKNWKRLGKTMTDSAGDIAQMGMNTSHLNSLFGKGKVDTQEYARTVSDLAFQSGHYNQNTKFLIESLNRELAVQLSLGKSRDAALDAARRNLEKAGKANILGAQIIGKKLQEEFDGGKISIADAMERFGSQGELVYRLLEEGIGKGNNLFALAELLKEGSELQGELQKEIRRDARAGGGIGMAAGVLSFPEQEVMALQERVRGEKFENIRAADFKKQEGRETIKEALDSLFPGVGDIKDPEKKAEAQELIEQFARELRGDDPKVDAFDKFDEVIEALMPAEDPEKAKDPVDKFLEKVGGGKKFALALGAIIQMPKVIAGLPVTMAAALAAEKAKEMGLFDKLKEAVTFGDAEYTPVAESKLAGSIGSAAKRLSRKKMEARFGERYDRGIRSENKEGGIGRAEVQGLTREDFIKKMMTEEAAKKAAKLTSGGTPAEVARHLAQQKAAKATEATLPPTEATKAQAVKDASSVSIGKAARPSQAVGESPPVSRDGAGGAVAANAKASRSGANLVLTVERFDEIVAQVQYDQTAVA